MPAATAFEQESARTRQRVHAEAARDVEALVKMIEEWPIQVCDADADAARRAWFDFGVSRVGLGAARIAEMEAQRTAWLEAAMDAKYGGRAPAHMRPLRQP